MIYHIKTIQVIFIIGEYGLEVEILKHMKIILEDLIVNMECRHSLKYQQLKNLLLENIKCNKIHYIIIKNI